MTLQYSNCNLLVSKISHLYFPMRSSLVRKEERESLSTVAVIIYLTFINSPFICHCLSQCFGSGCFSRFRIRSDQNNEIILSKQLNILFAIIVLMPSSTLYQWLIKRTDWIHNPALSMSLNHHLYCLYLSVHQCFIKSNQQS